RDGDASGLIFPFGRVCRHLLLLHLHAHGRLRHGYLGFKDAGFRPVGSRCRASHAGAAILWVHHGAMMTPGRGWLAIHSPAWARLTVRAPTACRRWRTIDGAGSFRIAAKLDIA